MLSLRTIIAWSWHGTSGLETAGQALGTLAPPPAESTGSSAVLAGMARITYKAVCGVSFHRSDGSQMI